MEFGHRWPTFLNTEGLKKRKHRNYVKIKHSDWFNLVT